MALASWSLKVNICIHVCVCVCIEIGGGEKELRKTPQKIMYVNVAKLISFFHDEMSIL